MAEAIMTPALLIRAWTEPEYHLDVYIAANRVSF
jgi:hypothetical protein